MPVYHTQTDLQALRYCNRILGNVIIDIPDVGADFAGLYDISVIEGLCVNDIGCFDS